MQSSQALKPRRLDRQDDFPGIVSIGTALPPYRLTQQEIREAAGQHFESLRDSKRLLSVFDHVKVEQRYFCVPLEWFSQPHSFTEKNDRYIEWAETLSEEAVTSCLEQAGVGAEEIDHLLFVSTSGLATPSIDARLINRLPLRHDVRRTPVFGLGCAGGVAGLARTFELTASRKNNKILMVSIELSSLTFQALDFSKGNFVASSLFSDGSAAILVDSAAMPAEHPRFLDSRSLIWGNTLDIMGWRFGEHGLEVIFSRRIPSFIENHFRPALEDFLASNNLTLNEIDHFLVHPGGARILDALDRSLALPPQTLRSSRQVLSSYGNMSSPTALFILRDHWKEFPPTGEGYALLAAFGPGFSTEMVLLGW